MLGENTIGPQEGPQELLLKCPVEISDIFFGGARGGGKTYGLILKFQQHHDLYGDAMRGLILRKTVPQLADFIFKAKGIFLQLGWEFKKGERKFVNLTTGAEILLRHMESDEDADDYLGHEYTIIGIEELGDYAGDTEEGTQRPIPGLAIRKVKATLRSSRGVPTVFIATGNPGGKGHEWIKATYIDPAPPMTPFQDPVTGKWRIFIPSFLEDNKILCENDPSYRDSLKDAGPAWLVAAWLQGDWDIAPSGNTFRREYFEKRYPQMLPLHSYQLIIHSWDTAYKDHKNADRSAFTCWGVTQTEIHLLHAWAGRLTFPALKQKAKDLANLFPPHALFVEDKASGTSLIQELKEGTSLPVIAVPVDQNKVARAFSSTPAFESGKILLPSPDLNLPWVHEYIEEMVAFPTREHDDYVDCSSQAISRLRHYTNLMFNTSNVVPFTGSLHSL